MSSHRIIVGDPPRTKCPHCKELEKALDEGRELVLKSVTHVTHGRPTIEEAYAWVQRVERVLERREKP